MMPCGPEKPGPPHWGFPSLRDFAPPAPKIPVNPTPSANVLPGTKRGSMKRYALTCLTSLALAAGVLPASATPTAAPLKAVRAAGHIVLDGRLDDEAWSLAAPSGPFLQRNPDEGKPASERTEVRVVYDDEALYVGARMFDSQPQGVVRRLSRRDDEPDADRFVLYLDPRHDHHNGFEFWVSAAGVQRDAVIYNDSWDDFSWDGVWEAAVAADETGWTAEVKIPFSQLRFTEGGDQVWGVNAARFIHRKAEEDWLELVPKKESGIASRMAHLEGLAGLHPRRALSLLPYAVSRGEFVTPSRTGDPFNDGSRALGSLGLDLKYGITSSLTLDATVNPDFGQVEVDPAVVNLSDYETFFDEKRPFFIEGSPIFNNFGHNGANNFWGFNRSEPDIFYSRRIGRAPQGGADAEFVHMPSAATILGAAKVTGRVGGGWTVAGLEAVTGGEDARLADGPLRRSQEVEPFTNYFVARAQHDGERVGLGALTTSVVRTLDIPALSDLLARNAWVGGVDGYVFLDKKKNWAVTARFAGSRIEGSTAAITRAQRASQRYYQRPDATQVELDPFATSLSGWTGSVNLNRQGGTFRVNSALWATSPGFESNDLGFNSRTDRWGGHLVADYRKTDTDRYTRSRWFAVSKWYALNFAGERQGDGLHGFYELQFKNYWWLGGNGFKRWQALDDRLTRGGPSVVSPAAWGAGLWSRTDTRKRLVLRLDSSYFENAAGTTERMLSTTVEMKPASAVFVSIGPSIYVLRSAASWVTGVDDPLAAATYGRRYVFGELHQTEASMTTRVNWILSPRMSLQVYAQPLISVGDYGRFKELARGRTFDFNRYGAGGSTIAPSGGTYAVDPDGAGPAPAFTFDNPDFNFKSLRVNAIYRWEWRPGSTLYVAWTQQRQDVEDPGVFELGHDTSRLLRAPGDDVFLVKVSYRFGR